MCDLDRGLGVEAVDQRGEGGVVRDVRIIPDAEASMGDASLDVHRALLDEHETGAAGGELADMRGVPIGGAPPTRRIGRHRRDHDPVLQCEVAQLQRGKQQRQFGHVMSTFACGLRIRESHHFFSSGQALSSGVAKASLPGITCTSFS